MRGRILGGLREKYRSLPQPVGLPFAAYDFGSGSADGLLRLRERCRVAVPV